MTAQQPEREPTVADLVGAADGGPTVLRIALGARLRQLREAAGVSRDKAGWHIRGSHAKISRLELGRVGAKPRDVQDLLTLYGVHDEREREAFLDLARQANEPGWWQRYSDAMPSWFGLYLGLEHAAAQARLYQVQFVPGLLQTADYARAITTAWRGDLTAAEVDRRVELRLRRQEVLERAEPLDLWPVLDVEALRRPVGGPGVLRGQLQRLAELADRPNVRLQVLGDRTAGHASAAGPFTILRFGHDALPDIVYLELLTGAVYLDKPHEVDQYALAMNRLVVDAEPPDATPAILAELLRTL